MLTLKMKIILTAMFVTIIAFTVAGNAIAGLPSAEELAEKVGFSAADRKKIFNGELVSTTFDSTNERELAVGIAFYVRLSVDELRKEMDQQLLPMTKDSNIIAWAPVMGDGSLDDFKTLSLAPNAKKRAKVYLNAKPGDDLNLDKTEISAFNAISVPDEASVTAAVKKQLLDRFQAYRQAGLGGIAPYDRGNGNNTPAASDLKHASEASVNLKKAMPDFYKVLLNYPNDKPDALDEEFTWFNYMAQGEPIFILTHHLKMAGEGVFVNVVRQFYVSGSYNAGQTIIGFLPVKNGTVVFYMNRISTDRVTGFGSSVKRSMGSKIMTMQLKDLYEKARMRVEKGTK